MKIGPKEAQRRALREGTQVRGADRALAALEEVETAEVHPEAERPSEAEGRGFDRKAYQREYMRRWRKDRPKKP